MRTPRLKCDTPIFFTINILHNKEYPSACFAMHKWMLRIYCGIRMIHTSFFYEKAHKGTFKKGVPLRAVEPRLIILAESRASASHHQ